eukprot:NODE_8819_length_1467_cov_13.194776.p1 GENE.NODE_8819_length_1467_cov_13.194776~~NODE_8819_length_1467_cov_13.194776.p1  ORF type:complete len:380 (+),score=70.87 NODE_8819_length_1467_cov_13.194776:101-1240(+)
MGVCSCTDDSAAAKAAEMFHSPCPDDDFLGFPPGDVRARHYREVWAKYETATPTDVTLVISSQLDAAEQTEEFVDAPVATIGTLPSGFGYLCKKGRKSMSKPAINQDAWLSAQLDDRFFVYAVFDGHGKNGHWVAHRVKDYFLTSLTAAPDGVAQLVKCKGPEKVLTDCLRDAQGALITDKDSSMAMHSGTTATVCIHDLSLNTLTVANVGDSTCVLGTRRVGADPFGTPLMRDHKPELDDERTRITQHGGIVRFDGSYDHRVYDFRGKGPGLNMSRSLGDTYVHRLCGVSCIPEVRTHTVSSEDQVLLLCSDGVWGNVTPDEAVAVVMDCKPQDAMQAAAALYSLASTRWMEYYRGPFMDDITILVIYLQSIEIRHNI